MTKLKTIFIAFFLGLLLSFNASAWWGGGGPWNNGWGGGPWNHNSWPVWTPMYWAEEMSDEWGDNDYWGGPGSYGGYPYGGYGAYPYGAYPYGGGLPYGGYGGHPNSGSFPYPGYW